jgi:hypothetical protein
VFVERAELDRYLIPDLALTASVTFATIASIPTAASRAFAVGDPAYQPEVVVLGYGHLVPERFGHAANAGRSVDPRRVDEECLADFSTGLPA